MRSRDLSSWMWGDALSLIERAERLRQQFFSDALTQARSWEPPIDVVETHDELTVYVALPGVPTSDVAVRFSPCGISVSGFRRFPASKPTRRIHRIEIPYGRFERHIPLPLHALEPAPPEMTNGCLVMTFKKLKEGL